MQANRTACLLHSRAKKSSGTQLQLNMAPNGLMQVALLVLAVAAVASAGAEGESPVHVAGQDYDSSRVYVPCTRDIFAGTKFYGSGRLPGVAEWITR